MWREYKSSYFSCNELTSELVKESWETTVYTKKESIGSQSKKMKSHTRKKYISSWPQLPLQQCPEAGGWRLWERSRGRACEPWFISAELSFKYKDNLGHAVTQGLLFSWALPEHRKTSAKDWRWRVSVDCFQPKARVKQKRGWEQQRKGKVNILTVDRWHRHRISQGLQGREGRGSSLNASVCSRGSEDMTESWQMNLYKHNDI